MIFTNKEIKIILDNYLKAVKEKDQQNQGAVYVRNNLKNSILNSKCINTKKYLVKGSSGNGNVSEIPWICIFDRDITLSAQSGYYVGYLFRADMKGVYLSLNQGWTQFKNKNNEKDALEKISLVSDFIRNSINTNITNFDNYNINLNCEGKLGHGYEAGHICGKYYPADSLPDDDELVSDLNEMMGIYREVKGLFKGKKYSEIAKEILSNNFNDLIASTSEIENSTLFQEKIQSADPSHTKDEPKSNKSLKKTNNGVSWQRNEHIAKEAIEDAGYKCEANNEHYTFLNDSGQVYMEGHHLIPISYQGGFKYSLDVKSNIVSLCPNCHRKLHYGTLDEKKELLQLLYDSRIKRLNNCSINISFNKLLEMYNKNNS